MYSRVIVEPPVEPITLTEVKLQSAVTHALHDDMFTAYILSARQYVESYCLRSLITQTRETAYDAFACVLRLPYGPVQEVLSVEYVAADGVATPITDYQVDLYADVPRLMPAYNGLWPSTVGASLNAVTVRYVAGSTPVEGSPTDYTSSVPSPIKTAMKLLVGHWYENREATIAGQQGLTEIPLGVECLLSAYKLGLGMA
jgi:uncharacterized phiE125 gp8 family phage protein